MPGAFTPTEILAAWEAGADVVKVFPADVGGPAYLKAIRGPLPQIRLMPTGGVDLDTAESFLKAGACCLGVGSALVDPKAIAAGDFGRIRDLAAQYAAIVRRCPGDLIEPCSTFPSSLFPRAYRSTNTLAGAVVIGLIVRSA